MLMVNGCSVTWDYKPKLVMAVQDHKSTEKGALTFKMFDYILVIRPPINMMWEGRLGNNTGFFPCDSVVDCPSVVVDDDSKMVALEGWSATNPYELSFTEGDHVILRFKDTASGLIVIENKDGHVGYAHPHYLQLESVLRSKSEITGRDSDDSGYKDLSPPTSNGRKTSKRKANKGLLDVLRERETLRPKSLGRILGAGTLLRTVKSEQALLTAGDTSGDESSVGATIQEENDASKMDATISQRLSGRYDTVKFKSVTSKHSHRRDSALHRSSGKIIPRRKSCPDFDRNPSKKKDVEFSKSALTLGDLKRLSMMGRIGPSETVEPIIKKLGSIPSSQKSIPSSQKSEDRKRDLVHKLGLTLTIDTSGEYVDAPSDMPASPPPPPPPRASV